MKRAPEPAEETPGRRFALAAYGVLLILAIFPAVAWAGVAYVFASGGHSELMLLHANATAYASITLVGSGTAALVFAALPRERTYQIYAVTIPPLAHFVFILVTLALALEGS